MNRLPALLHVLLTGLLAALVLLPAAYAQSGAISFQGRLTNADGTPVPDGTYEVTFALYDSETGGTPLWIETQPVPVRNGVFGGNLGNLPITAHVISELEAYHLELTINGEPLTPRTPLTAVPFALAAHTLGPEALEAGANVTLERQDNGSVMVSFGGTFSGGWDGISLIGEGTQENPLRVADGGITEEKLADGSITGAKIADGAIVGGENVLVSRLNDGSVRIEGTSEGFTMVHIEAFGLTGNGTPENPLRVADGGITEEKLADGSVTGLKLAGGAIVGGENILVSRQNDGSVRIDGTSEGFTMVHIEAFGLTGNGTPENPLGLANGGVTSAKLADESVTSAKLDERSVTASKLAEGSVTASKLAEGSVTASKLDEESVTASKLDDRVIKAGDGIQVTRTNTGSFEIAIKRGAAFRVNQLLDAENLPLLPGIVASPEPTAVYNGNVVLDARGEAVVVLPESFAALSDEVRYQLTCIGGFAPVYVAEEITANRFSIAGGMPGMKVSWQVTGVR